MRSSDEILREYYIVERKIVAGEKGQTALKKYARKLYKEYVSSLELA